MSRVERRVGLVVIRVFAVALLAVTAVALLAPRNTWFVFHRPVVTVVAGAAALALAAFVVLTRRRTLPGSAWVRRRPGLTVALGTGVATVLAGIHAAAATIRVGWDAGAVADASRVLQEGGQLDAHLLDYFARFPNNVTLLLFETTAAEVGARLGLPVMATMTIAQVLLLAVIVASVGRTAQVLGHPDRIVPVQATALLLIGLSPHVAAPYTDIPGAACVAVAMAAMASAHVAPSPRRLAWGALAVVALTIGIALKPFVGVVLVAVALVAVLVVVGTRSWVAARRALLVSLAAALLAVLTSAGLSQVAQHATGLTDDRLQAVRHPFPVELWLASGTYDTEDPSPVRRYGAYSQPLIDEAAALTDPDEQRQMLRERIGDQITGRGIAANLRFFSAKVAWVWSDGTFWAHGEGTDSRQPSPHTSGPLRMLSEVSVATGEHYRLRASIVQGLWLALLGAIGLALLRATYDRLLATWCLSLIGLTGYLTLFEARPRYVLSLVPVLLVIAAAVAVTNERRRRGASSGSASAPGRPARSRPG